MHILNFETNIHYKIVCFIQINLYLCNLNYFVILCGVIYNYLIIN